jgi:cysteine desulfurase
MKDIEQIYLDYASTTPVDSEVLDAMLPYFKENFGNSGSSTHSYGWKAKGGVQSARRICQQYFNCDEQEFIFTSGATESINLALKGGYELMRPYGNHIITSKVEHKAVLDTCNYLETQGARITYLDVNQDGEIDINELESAITSETILLTFMWVNNETGVINPIEQIGEIAKARKLFFFTDATQALGKVKINLKENHIAAASFSGHKVYGPKGIGGLYLSRKSPRFQPVTQQFGGGQEFGFRAGTLNTPGIVGFGKAVENIEKDQSQICSLSKRIINGMKELGFMLNAEGAERVPHIMSFYHPKHRAQEIIKAAKSLAFSLGSACNSDKGEPSHVIATMNLPGDVAQKTFRISIGKNITEEEAQSTLEVFSQI